MGCSESKHAVATTESLSTRKKLTSNSSKKVQNPKVPHDGKPIDIEDDNTNFNGNLDNVQDQEVAICASQGESATKQVENNTSIIDSHMKNDLVSNPKEQEQEDKKIQVANSEVLLPLSKEEGPDHKLATECEDENLCMNEESKKLSSQDGSCQTFASGVGEKQEELVEGDIESNNKKDEIIEHGTSKIAKEVEVQNALNATRQTCDDEEKDVETRHEGVVESIWKAGQENDENEPEVKQHNDATKPNTRQEVVETKQKEDVEDNVETNAKVEQENEDINYDTTQDNAETTVEQELENDKNKIDDNQKDIETKSKVEQEVVETTSEVEHEDVATPKPEQEDITTAMVIFGRMRESVLQKIEQDSESENAPTCP